LGQWFCAEDPDKPAAIRELPKKIDVERGVVTIDAMGPPKASPLRSSVARRSMLFADPPPAAAMSIGGGNSQ
jgi:hypothetical protein